MRLKACDFETGPPAAELRRLGFRAVGRYLSTPGNPKNLTRAELETYRSAGLSVWLVFETTASRALTGVVGGRVDGQSAIGQVLALGLPRETPVYFAVDFDASDAELGAVVAYIAGASHVRGKDSTGVYGGGRVLEACRKYGACRYFWQAGASAWGAPLPGRHLQQEPTSTVAGHSVDVDYALRRDFGQVPRPALKRLVGLALEYAHWPHWRRRVLGPR